MNVLRSVLGTALLWVAPAFSAQITYVANLTGPGESPPNASPGTGFTDVIFDSTAQTLTVMVTFSNLTTGTTASHIHCCVFRLTLQASPPRSRPFPGFRWE
jgi:hypothetical protein